MNLHALAPHIEQVRLQLQRAAGFRILEALLDAPQRLGTKGALFGQDLRADVEAAALVAARERDVHMLSVSGLQLPRKITADHVIRLVRKRSLDIGAVGVPSLAL